MSTALLLLQGRDVRVVAAVAARSYRLPKDRESVAAVARMAAVSNDEVERVVELMESTDLLGDDGQPHSTLVQYLEKQSLYLYSDEGRDD